MKTAIVYVPALILSASWLYYEIRTVLQEKRDWITLRREDIPLNPNVSGNSPNCTIHTCGTRILSSACTKRRLGVFVQPLLNVFDEDGQEISPSPSQEFLRLRDAILQSEWNTANVEEACVSILGIDTLVVGRFPSRAHFSAAVEASTKLLPESTNVAVFVLNGRDAPVGGDRILISAQSTVSSFRPNMDVAMGWPMDLVAQKSTEIPSRRQQGDDFDVCVPLMDTEGSTIERIRTEVKSSRVNERLLFLVNCARGHKVCDMETTKELLWPDVLENCRFVLIDERASVDLERRVSAVLKSKTAVPLIFAPKHVRPLNGRIDWSRTSVSLFSVEDTLNVTRNLGETRRLIIRDRATNVARRHFGSLELSVRSALRVLEEIFLPQVSRSRDWWTFYEEVERDVTLSLAKLPEKATLTAVLLIDAEDLDRSMRAIRQFVASLGDWPRLDEIRVVFGEESDVRFDAADFGTHTATSHPKIVVFAEKNAKFERRLRSALTHGVRSDGLLVCTSIAAVEAATRSFSKLENSVQLWISTAGARLLSVQFEDGEKCTGRTTALVHFLQATLPLERRNPLPAVDCERARDFERHLLRLGNVEEDGEEHFFHRATDGGEERWDCRTRATEREDEHDDGELERLLSTGVWLR